jgi:hypothetical protein
MTGVIIVLSILVVILAATTLMLRGRTPHVPEAISDTLTPVPTSWDSYLLITIRYDEPGPRIVHAGTFSHDQITCMSGEVHAVLFHATSCVNYQGAVDGVMHAIENYPNIHWVKDYLDKWHD